MPGPALPRESARRCHGGRGGHRRFRRGLGRWRGRRGGGGLGDRCRARGRCRGLRRCRRDRRPCGSGQPRRGLGRPRRGASGPGNGRRRRRGTHDGRAGERGGRDGRHRTGGDGRRERDAHAGSDLLGAQAALAAQGETTGADGRGPRPRVVSETTRLPAEGLAVPRGACDRNLGRLAGAARACRRRRAHERTHDRQPCQHVPAQPRCVHACLVPTRPCPSVSWHPNPRP